MPPKLQKQSRGYEQWAKIHNLKQAAKTMNFLTENKIEQYIMEAADRNQYLTVKQACDAKIEAAEKKIAELSKEMAMQAEMDDEQLKELENISLFAREPALTKEMVEAMRKVKNVKRTNVCFLLYFIKAFVIY